MADLDKSQVLCKYFMHGACHFGSSCKFSHDISSTAPNMVCKFYLAGHCAFGDKCRYDHVKPTWSARGKAAAAANAPTHTASTPAGPRSASNAQAAAGWPAAAAAPAAAVVSSEGAAVTAGAGPASTSAAVHAGPVIPAPAAATPLAAASAAGTSNSTWRSAHQAWTSTASANAAASVSPIQTPAHPLHSAHADVHADPDADVDPDAEMHAHMEQLAQRVGLVVIDDDLGLVEEQFILEQRFGPTGLHRRPNAAAAGPAASTQPAGVDYTSLLQEDAAAGFGYYAEVGEEEEDGVEGAGYYDEAGYYHSGHLQGYFGTDQAQQEGEEEGQGAGPLWAGQHGQQGAGGGMNGHETAGNGISGQEGAEDADGSALCPEHSLSGTCSRGDGCCYMHGRQCGTCLKWRLHPSDPDLASEHASACAARHARLEGRLRSVTVECGICLEKVLSKPNPAARRFGLLACDHAFCLNCIREWRAHGAEGGVDVEGAVRTCPVCRVTSHYVTPSAVWPADAEEKEQVTSAYKSRLGQVDCRHFDYGEGECPFGTSCFYRHAYKDGRLEEPALRLAGTCEGKLRVLAPLSLSSFFDTPGARRALGGRRR